MDPEDVFRKEAPAPVSYLQYKGVWDMQDLYEFVASFFHRAKFKFYEKKYIHKRPGPFGPETYHVWEAIRNVEDYYRYVISIFLHTYDTQDIEVVMKDGSKKIFTKGRLWVQFKGKTEFDYEKKWQENNFYVHLQEFYHKYVIHKKIEAVFWDQMYYDVVMKLQALVRTRLKMESESYEYKDYHKVRG